MLAGNIIAYGAPMTYDQLTGAIGPFEIAEFAGIGAVLLAPGLTARSSGVVR